jgi:hypothetical protein
MLAGLACGSPCAAPADDSRTGLAGRYPDDAGIAADPAVLLAEDFESGDLADLATRWNEISNAGGRVLALVPGTVPGSRGRRTLEVTATLGVDTGGHLYTRLKREVDEVYARFYVRFATNADYIHHFVTVGGYHPGTRWPQGGAGERPAGEDRVTVGVEPTGVNGRFAAPGVWNIYAYWPEMRGSADGRYWGNSIQPELPARVPRDRWQCVEVRLKLNTRPDAHDGELDLWVDGQTALRVGRGSPRGAWTGMGFNLKTGGEPFEGFRWRTGLDLRINFFWLMHYVTENAARQNRVAQPERVNRVWFDNIVVATAYVGPVVARKP